MFSDFCFFFSSPEFSFLFVCILPFAYVFLWRYNIVCSTGAATKQDQFQCGIFLWGWQGSWLTPASAAGITRIFAITHTIQHTKYIIKL